LKKDWNSPVYAFFKPVPNVGHEGGHRYHEFLCAAKGCQKKVWHYLDKKDAKSMSNMQTHAKLCWGADVVEAADRTKNAKEACDSVIKPLTKDGSIMAIFECVGKGKVTYSHRQHMKTETK
jgi:hypothetical protein